MRWGFFLAAIFLVLACAIVPTIAPLPVQAAPAVPDRQQAGAASENQFLLLYPDLRQAPAPAWLVRFGSAPCSTKYFAMSK